MLSPEKKTTQHRYNIQGIELFFPYPLDPAQETLVNSIMGALKFNHNGLFHSPTGTGKTLCFLTSILAYMELNQKEDIRFFYCTRTHSQMNGIIKELKKSCYTPEICMLGSRNILCLNDELGNLDGEIKNLACSKIKKVCPYYKNLQDNMLIIENSLAGKVLDLEDLHTFALDFEVPIKDKVHEKLSEKEPFCPYYFCKSRIQKAQLIILTYNYLLDPKIRKAINPLLNNSVILFDEAHNIEEICEELLSFNVKNSYFKKILEVLQEIYDETPISENSKDKIFGGTKIFLRDLDLIMIEIDKFHKKINTSIPENKAQIILKQEGIEEFFSGTFSKSIEVLAMGDKKDAMIFKLEGHKKKTKDFIEIHKNNWENIFSPKHFRQKVRTYSSLFPDIRKFFYQKKLGCQDVIALF